MCIRDSPSSHACVTLVRRSILLLLIACAASVRGAQVGYSARSRREKEALLQQPEILEVRIAVAVHVRVGRARLEEHGLHEALSLIHISEPTRQAEISYA